MARLGGVPGPVSEPPILAIPALAQGLVHGFSTRGHGSMRREPGEAARRRFAGQLGADPDRLSVMGSVHGAGIARLRESHPLVEGVDALLTDVAGLPLGGVYGDCYPIVLLDPVRPALALIHAGWRGLDLGLPALAVEAMVAEFGSDPGELLAGIGPGICGGCYEVGEEVAGRFPAATVRPGRGGRALLDLELAARLQLEAAGVVPEAIHGSGTCTLESPLLPSHRAGDRDRFACLAQLR